MPASAAASPAQPPTIEGLDALRLSDGHVALDVIPALGGKIISLRDLRSGREWMGRNPFVPLAPQPPGASFLRDGDSGGWDECLPTVAACPMPGSPDVEAPDHGELWTEAWDVEAVDATSMTLSAAGRLHPYRLRRAIRLVPDAGAVRFDYALTNEGAMALPFIWSAHPILAVAPGATIRVPESARWSLYLDLPAGSVVLDAGRLLGPLPTSSAGGVTTLGPLPGSEAALAFKAWSAPGTAPWCEVIDVGGEALRFDLPQVPNLGLWVNLGGWAGRPEAAGRQYCVAVEPCIGAQDRLDDAVLHRRDHGLLGPGERQAWGFDVTLMGGG